MVKTILQLQQQELQHIIQPPMQTIIQQLNNAQASARENAGLLDGIMPRATLTEQQPTLTEQQLIQQLGQLYQPSYRIYLHDLLESYCNHYNYEAFSVTYLPRYQMLENEVMRKILISNLHFIHNNYDIPFGLVIVPDEDTQGNFHYHGVISIKQRDKRRFKKAMTLLNGFVKFAYIKEPDKWLAYVEKSITGQHEKVPEPIYDDEEYCKLSIVYDNRPVKVILKEDEQIGW